jgi:CBS domain-containing protein
MPYPVAHLIQGRPFPTTIQREDSVVTALDVMIEHDFSQLPVIDLNRHPVGMITHEGILKGVRNFKAPLANLRVRDVMIRAALFNVEDDLFDLLEQLKLSNAVLIINPEKKLVGIVTSYDSTEYFRTRAENLMRVEDIETMLRDFILAAFTEKDGEINHKKLTEALIRISPKDPVTGEKRRDLTFDQLTLSQYISMLTDKQPRPFFETIFKIPIPSLSDLLNEVRVTRNMLAHFRGEITPQQSDQLRFCADWLARCQDEYALSPGPSVVKVTEISQPAESVEQEEAVSEIAVEETAPKDSRYAPLADWLQSQPGRLNQVKLLFSEIEELIGGDLPASARKHRAWWANDSQTHPHAQAWLDAGWRSSYLNLSEQTVTFVRIQERQQAHINFFSKLLSELRKTGAFTVRDVSPGGSNWVGCQVISSPGFNAAHFGFSFIRGRGFRVELYIDAYDQDANKRAFDNIYTHKAELEVLLGEIRWERIGDKRASRIAQYHPGAITDDEKTLAELRQWAVEKMVAFYKAIEPIASQAIQKAVKP